MAGKVDMITCALLNPPTQATSSQTAASSVTGVGKGGVTVAVTRRCATERVG